MPSTRLQLPSHAPEDTRETSPRVLLVDDHDLFRTGLGTLLEAEGVDVVGEARTGADAVAGIRTLAPEMVVMDLNMLAGIGAAAAGESLISPAIASKVLQRFRASGVPARSDSTASELSDRELQVLRLIANGKDNAQIAAELHISPKTVKNHISNILTKLQIENRIQAAVFAVRSGIA